MTAKRRELSGAELFPPQGQWSLPDTNRSVELAPLPARLWPGKIRPNEHFYRIGEQACGVPDLVVEVLCPARRQTDRGEKFFEYAKAGIHEPITEPTRQARSKLLEGFSVPPDEIFS